MQIQLFLSRFLAMLVCLCFLNAIYAQESDESSRRLLPVIIDKNNQTLYFTAAPGTTSKTDTITLTQKEHGSRYKLYLYGDGRQYFKILPPFKEDKWIVLTSFKEVHVVVAFCPSTPLSEPAKVRLQIQAPYGTMGLVRLEGKTSN